MLINGLKLPSYRVALVNFYHRAPVQIDIILIQYVLAKITIYKKPKQASRWLQHYHRPLVQAFAIRIYLPPPDLKDSNYYIIPMAF